MARQAPVLSDAERMAAARAAAFRLREHIIELSAPAGGMCFCSGGCSGAGGHMRGRFAYVDPCNCWCHAAALKHADHSSGAIISELAQI